MFYTPMAGERRRHGNWTLLAEAPADDFVASWRSDFGIDVSELFDTAASGRRDLVRLFHDPDSGRIWFDPAIVGDEAFYQALRRFKWYHPKRKLEHAAAGRWAAAGARVLDIGAGDGAFAAHVSHARYRGLEPDPVSAEAGRARGLDLLAMDAGAYRRSELFSPADLATAFQVLEHVPDPDGFIRSMEACLAPDGRLAIGVPDGGSYIRDLPDFMLNAPPHHLTWWTEASLRTCLDANGFRVTAVERFPVEPWERQLYWMAAIARRFRRSERPRFGRRMRPLKVASFVAAWALQAWPLDQMKRGSTLLVRAERA